jgi:Ubiquitin carboxyl-terminal hydrolase
MTVIQNTLAECGWADAALIEQQDTSEAFAFLTETLQLPLLSLQVDLFHQGMNVKEDHKVVYERLLNLAVPPEADGRVIKLEDCLEEYFNARVDVMRDSEEAKKSGTEDMGLLPALVHRKTIRLMTNDTNASSMAMTSSPISMTPIVPKFEQAESSQTEDTVTLQRIGPVEERRNA